MKRTLLLMRHAKSSWDDPALSDFKRPLNHRGERDAPMMARRLLEAGYGCDQMISSPARRALETATIVHGILRMTQPLLTHQALYMADIEDYRRVLQDVDDAVHHLMIVSHNPGTEEALTYFTGERVAKFPTAAYALIEIEGAWSQLTQGGGKLLRFDYPKAQPR